MATTATVAAERMNNNIHTITTECETRIEFCMKCEHSIFGTIIEITLADLYLKTINKIADFDLYSTHFLSLNSSLA